MASDDGRAGRSAAWGVAAAVFGTGTFATWQVAIAPGSSFSVVPTWFFGFITLVALYMCFATLSSWWPSRRSVVADLEDDPQY